jgi:hypothetical protein
MEKYRSKMKFRFLDLLRPDRFPYPYSLEQAFHIFKWMVTTGEEYTRYGSPGVRDLLNMRPSCLNSGQVNPITSLDDLRRRFHYALLAHEEVPLATSWKKANGICIQAEKWLAFPHYTPFGGNFGSEFDIEKSLKKLLEMSRGTNLNVSLNECHTDARWVCGVSVEVIPRGFYFVMHYGCEEDAGSSSWGHTLACSIDNEPFTDTMRRAISALAAMTA